MSNDDYFELFCNEQILKDYDLSYDEIENGTIGNGGDGGIDGFFIFANDVLINVDDSLPNFKGSLAIEVFIIQSKNKDSFKEDVIQKFISSAEDIFCFEKDIVQLKSVYNNDLIKCVEVFKKLFLENITKNPEVRFNYYYASRGIEIHPNVSRKVDSLKRVIKSLFTTADIDLKFITAEHLFAMSKKKQKETYTLKLKENPITTDDGGYICLSKLTDYFDFISDDKKLIQKYLFDANVRDYQGSVIVNKEINKTLKEEKSFEFWWLNIGITIVADKASVSSKILTLKNPQIVNGCQTSYEKFSYFSKNIDSQDARSLTIRVIVTDDDSIKSRVIKSTNSQTAISPAVLSATDPIHRSIEEYFMHNGLYYDRRKNYWKNEQKPKTDIIPISLLAQSFKAMILQEPHISRAKPSSLVKESDDYKQIFSANYDLKGYLKIIQVQRAIERELKEKPYLDKGDGLNIRYFTYLFFVLIQRRNPKKSVVDVKAYFDEFIEMQIDDSLIVSSIKSVFEIYENKGKTDGTAKSKAFSDAVTAKALEQNTYFKLHESEENCF